MELHQLRVFVAAAETGSFTRAGEKLNTTQSTISQHIRHLEDNLNCQLFIRIGKRVVLSDAGRVLLQYCEKIFNDVKNAEMAIRELNGLQIGSLKLGTGVTTLTYQLPPILKIFKANFPGIELDILTEKTEVILQQVKAQALDLGIVTLPIPESDLQVTKIFSEELLVTLSAGDPRARQKALTVNDLAAMPFIVYDKQTMLRSLVDDFFSGLGIKPRIIVEVGNVEAIKSLVEVGLGASVLPKYSVRREVQGGTLRQLQVEGRKLYRDGALILPKTNFVPNAARALAKLIVAHLGHKRAPPPKSSGGRPGRY